MNGSDTGARADSAWLEGRGYLRDCASGVWAPRASGASAFAYTDGEAVERRLLEAVRGTHDRSVLSMSLREQITDWPSRYHLSPVRANLLRPLEHLFAGRAVLEIGAGCGALTRYLGECGARVIALEGSARRAAVAAARCEDLPEVSVVADALQNFEVERKFDVVTLIGVLEYARIHYAGAAAGDPVDAMLGRVRSLLKPGGVLVVAIENQLGLKYFAGYREDHVSAPMYGIEDLYEAAGVVTFGREELRERLSCAGFAAQNWLYPFPDYKLPASILTERGAAHRDGVDLAPLLAASVVADPQVPPAFSFSLEQAWQPVFRNRLADELANSFLVVAGCSEFDHIVPAEVLAYHYSVERRPCFAKALEVSIGAHGAVARSRALSEAASAGEVSIPLVQRLEDQPYFEGRLWHAELVRILNRPGWTIAGVAAWLRVWMGHVMEAAGLGGEPFTQRVRFAGSLIDAVPRNLVVSAAGGRFFDLEWTTPSGVEAGHLLYRGIVLSLLSVGSCAAPAAGLSTDIEGLFIEIARACGQGVEHQDFARFHAAEQEFQRWVHGGRWIALDELATHRLPGRSLLAG